VENTKSPSRTGIRLGWVLACAVRSLLAADLVLLSGAAMAGPEVVRVRVPAKDVTKIFPPGTELRLLTPQEFDTRIEAARREPAGGRSAFAPRLIRARHRARWDSGLLRGRSELIVEAGPAGPIEFPLEPWTPAILPGTERAPAVGARDSGSAVLRLDAPAGARPSRIQWEQQPRLHSRGRGFSLGLPADDTTVLELELPRGWSASSQRGIRRGPIPTDDPAWDLWEIDGEAGRFDLELRDPTDRREAGFGSGAWMSGTTKVDLGRTADPSGAIRNWAAECGIELDPRHAGRLEAELDPGLELIDVQGPAVQGYRTDRSETGTRVTVTIAEGVRSATLQFLAHARVPSEGAWTIPAIRPLDAVWTGGRTTVILDELHVVSECRERAGRLLPPGRGDAREANRLDFEAASPRSVAELVFIRPRAEVSCMVRGQLILGGTPPRLDCRLDWSLHRGSISQFEVDLAPGWLPDQVRLQGVEDPLAWHSSTLPSGVTRLRVMLPASVLGRSGWALTVGATSQSTTERDPLELPRVHPVDVAVADEAWLAWGDDRTTIQPIQARGLAWIDPAEVPGLVTAPPLQELREALAWRWTAEAAEARVERDRIDQDPRVSIRTRVHLSPDGREVSIEGKLLIGSGAATLDSLPIWLVAPGDPLASWRFTADDGSALPLRPIEGPARARLELPRDASVRALTLNLPAQAEKAVSFRAIMPWSSSGLVPLLFAPREYLKQGTVLVETPAWMKSGARTAGLGRLHPSAIEVPKAGRGPDETNLSGRDSSRDRVVNAYSYTEPGARLELTTEPMEPSPIPGIVREAFLTTCVDAPDGTLHRLRLVVQLNQADSFDLELPDGATLVRVRRDGNAVNPIRSSSRLTIPVPATGHGNRTSAIVVDYLTRVGTLGDGSILLPDPPRPDFPCLSFNWEVISPPGWRAIDPGSGLIAIEPDDPADWPNGPLGLWRPGWPLRAGRGNPDLNQRLQELDDRIGRPAPDELSFAEWFSRWDAGPWPVVIDQLALGSAGLGPKSSCFPGRLASDRRQSARALLQEHGLAVVPFSDALLITTESERPRFGRRGPWLEAIAEALAWGSDRADRFQSVRQWRGDSVPRSLAAPDESDERNPSLPGRIIWRFSAPGWPGADAFVHLVDARRRMLTGWIVSGLLVLVWLAASRRASGRWLILPTLAVAACVVLERILPARHGAVTAGGFAGSLAILIIELARRSPRGWSRPAPVVRTESSLIRGAARAAAGPASLLVLAVTLGALRAAPAGEDSPILALFPYEGTFDPARPPDRVILRLEDFHRLTRRAGEDKTPRATVTALSAAHRVARRSGQAILVETEIELDARGHGPLAWRIPVSSARDISAALDGQSVPIAVEPGGDVATVVLPTAGNHRLRLRRWTAARSEEGGAEVINLPVNAIPAARLIVDPPADGTPQGIAVTRGRIERRPDRTMAGQLGPIDRITVRWARPGRDATARAVGPVEGLILWDVTQAGDRIRTSLTYHGNDEITTIRLEHDAGLVLRSVRPPGRSHVYREKDPANGQWLLTFDPPLPRVSTLWVDCWRPLPDDPAAPGAPRGPGGHAAPRVRSFPRIRPVAAERFTGVLGVRRPGDWTGRLEPIPETEPIDDEAFVRAWGRLPAEPLTLAGTTRFDREVAAEFRTGPAPPRVVIHPVVQLRIESGRIAVAADADVEVSGHAPIVDAELPEDMRITQVAGDGLVDWTIPADRRLRLIWQRRESGRRRHVRILGWIPIVSDPLKLGAARQQVRTPWVGWPGVEVAPGSLVVSGGAAPEIAGGTGLMPAPTAALPEPHIGAGAGGAALVVQETSAALAGSRLSYQVNDPARLGELTWESRPPRVAVVVESQLTIHPDFAQWVAVIRYDITGGSLDRINLRIPAPWAARARLSLSGEGPQPQPQVIGPSAFWSITPRRPLWASHRFVLRSTLAIGSGREIVQPEVAPLGRGAVDAYLGIVNATGRPLAAEDATGLQAIPYASRFREWEFARDAGTPSGAYRVTKRPWTLRVQLPRGGPEPGASDDATRVSLADVALTVTPDRSVLGRAMYEIVPDGGRLLTLEFPPGSTLLWAAVEPDPAVPLRAGPSAWSIVLDRGRPGRVCVIWRTPPAVAAESSDPDGWSLALPRAGLGPARTLVSVSTPPGLTVERIPAGFEPATMARLDRARADWLGQSIRDALAKLDVSSGRDHERLVGLLINHDLVLRAADRAARWKPSLAQGSAGEQDLLESIPTARAEVARSVRAAGLTDDLALVQGYLGLTPGPSNRPPGGIPEPVSSCRIRAFGRPTAMLGVVQGLDDPSAHSGLTLGDAARIEPSDGGATRAAILGAALAVAVIIATVLAGPRAPLAAAVSLAVMLIISALAGGPLLLAGGLALAVIAWRSARPG
jgi:hypothetical protein